MLTRLKIRWAQFKVNRTKQYEYVRVPRMFGGREIRVGAEVEEEMFTKGWLDKRPTQLVNTSVSFKGLNQARTNMGDIPSYEDLRELWEGLSEIERQAHMDKWWNTELQLKGSTIGTAKTGELPGLEPV